MPDDEDRGASPGDSATPPYTRGSTRVPLESEVRLQFDDLEGFVREFAANVSMGGMFIRTVEPRPVGTLLQLQLRLHDDTRLVEGVGEVVWTRPRDGGPSRPAGMGVRFLALEPESRSLLFAMVDNYIEEGGEPFDLHRAQTGSGAAGVDRRTPTAEPRGAPPGSLGEPPWAGRWSGSSAAEAVLETASDGEDERPLAADDLLPDLSPELAEAPPDTPADAVAEEAPPVGAALHHYESVTPPRSPRRGLLTASIALIAVVLVAFVLRGRLEQWFPAAPAVEVGPEAGGAGPVDGERPPASAVGGETPAGPESGTEDAVTPTQPLRAPAEGEGTPSPSAPPRPSAVAGTVEGGAGGGAASDQPATAPSGSPATRLEGIETERRGEETVVTLRADGELAPDRVAHLRIEGPAPRLVVTIKRVTSAWANRRIEVGSPEVDQIRTGYHPVERELHVVLDLADPAVHLVDLTPRGSSVALRLTRQPG